MTILFCLLIKILSSLVGRSYCATVDSVSGMPACTCDWSHLHMHFDS